MQHASNESEDRPGREPGTGAEVELTEAATVLGLSTQGLWALIEQAGLRVLRRSRAGSPRSALTQADFERLRRSCATRGGPDAEPLPPEAEPLDPLGPLMQRVRAAEARSEDLEAGVLELRSRLVETGLQVGEAHRRMLALRERFEAELLAAHSQLSARDRKLSLAQVELEAEREQGRLTLAQLGDECESMQRELELARQFQQANEAYMNRLEQRLPKRQRSGPTRSGGDDARRSA